MFFPHGYKPECFRPANWQNTRVHRGLHTCGYCPYIFISGCICLILSDWIFFFFFFYRKTELKQVVALLKHICRINGYCMLRIKYPVLHQTEIVFHVFKWKCQMLTASFKLLPYQTILKEINGVSHIEKPLITMHILCHPHSLSLLRLCLHTSIFHSLCSSILTLFICFLWCILPLSTLLSVLPSFPKMDCLSVFLLFSAHHTQTHTLTCSHLKYFVLTFFICSSCSLFLILPVHPLKEQYKSKVCTRFIPMITYRGAVAITLILLISTLCTVHSLSSNILSKANWGEGTHPLSS